MAELQIGDSTRVLPKQVVKDASNKLVKTAQRAWLSTKKNGLYRADLKDSTGAVIASIAIDLAVPDGGTGEIEMRLQVYPQEPL